MGEPEDVAFLEEDGVVLGELFQLGVVDCEHELYFRKDFVPDELGSVFLPLFFLFLHLLPFRFSLFFI